MKKIFVLLALCALGGCYDEGSVESEKHFQSHQLFYKYQWFHKDWETDICYSMSGSPNWNNFSHATVPCTEKVMAKIINKREQCDNECRKSKTAPLKQK